MISKWSKHSLFFLSVIIISCIQCVCVCVCVLRSHLTPRVIPDCSSDVALQVMTSRCQGKRSCVVRASTQEFGDPCYHGTRKYLSIIHTCGELHTSTRHPHTPPLPSVTILHWATAHCVTQTMSEHSEF